MGAPVSASAPGKIILLGEHAVVYGRPAIAIPVHQVQATVLAEPAASGAGLTLVAADLARRVSLDQAEDDDPLAVAARLTLEHLGRPRVDCVLTIRSTVPIASGLGSGAAVSTAIVRALGRFVGQELAPETVSSLVYEVEKLHHGTPSGVDNTVVAFGLPVYFVRGQGVETFEIGLSLHLLIADTGVSSPTRAVVEDVRRARDRDPTRYDALFHSIGRLVDQARSLLEMGGDLTELGGLMDRNHRLLSAMGVSSPALETLVDSARTAGALGAKLSGAGRGGNMIALVQAGDAPQVADALQEAGAVRVIESILAA